MPYRARPADRFIPYRRSHTDTVRHKLLFSPCRESTFEHSEASNAYRRLLAAVFAVPPIDERILQFYPKEETARERPETPCGLTHAQMTACRNDLLDARRRDMATTAESVRDLPGFSDDFYTHLMDWGENDNIVVAIGNEVYMWDYREKSASEQGVIHTHGRHVDCEISGLLWRPSSDNILVSCNDGDVMLWDVVKSKTVDEYTDIHSSERSPVGSLVWLDHHTFLVGSRRGELARMDTRQTKSVDVHTRGVCVCGIRISPCGRYVAVGRDDGVVQVLGARGCGVYASIKAHTAGVRAMAWCPWQPSVLTTGGGSSDGHIRQYNVHTQTMLFEVDCKSQVCEIVWSSEVREMVSSHGTPEEEGNTIELWQLVNSTTSHLVHIGSFTGHRARPMHLSLGVDNITLASASGDESLRIWKAFHSSHPTKKTSSSLDLFTAIR